MTDYDASLLGQASKETLKLEWVYGYRGRDCRNNLYQLPTGELVYFTAAVVVLYNVQDHMQRHYLGHTDDVKCLAVHPDKITIATGQVAGHDKKEGRGNKKDAGDSLPHVRIWDSVSLNTLHVTASVISTEQWPAFHSPKQMAATSWLRLTKPMNT
jgi:microtubule-associated protein-like 1/2